MDRLINNIVNRQIALTQCSGRFDSSVARQYIGSNLSYEKESRDNTIEGFILG